MSDIIDPAHSDDTYLGLVKVSLSKHWGNTSANNLNSNTYANYKNMRDWLYESQTKHRFVWIETGNYLPDFVYVPPDVAIMFKLRYE